MPQETLDPQAVMLAKSIRQSESGGNPTARGKSGEYGAYQYTPETWIKDSAFAGVNVPLEKATLEQQNEVAYKRIKSLKDAGMNPGQIASVWNSGDSDAYKGTFSTSTKTHKAGDPSKGTNSFGAYYDVPQYAKSVADAYQTLKQGGQVNADPNNPSSVSPQKGGGIAPPIAPTGSSAFQIGNPLAPPIQPPPSTTTPEPPLGSLASKGIGGIVNSAGSAVRNAFGAGGKGGTSSAHPAGTIDDLVNSPVSKAIQGIFPGKQVGQAIGTLGGLGLEKAKGLLGGKDNSKYYDISAPSVKDVAIDEAKGALLVGGLPPAGKVAGLAGKGVAGLMSKWSLFEKTHPIKAGLIAAAALHQLGKTEIGSKIVREVGLGNLLGSLGGTK